MNIGILGSGSWSLTVATLIVENRHRVTLWCHNPDTAAHINRHHRHPRLFPDKRLPDAIKADSDIKAVLSGAEMLILGTPSAYLDDAIDRLTPYFNPEIPVLSLVKGILEDHKEFLVSDYLLSRLPGIRLAVLSGPNLAAEIMNGLPAATVVAAQDEEVAIAFQRLITNGTFRVYTWSDSRGVEMGGLLKNIMAIAAGLIDGLALGTNARASLITRGLREMVRFAVHFGADDMTLYGLSGMGDLVATCSSDKSRNWQVGYHIARGKTLDQALAEIKSSVAEGVKTTRIISRIATEHGIDMPITQQIYDILYQNKSPGSAIRDLMNRELKAEL